MGSPTSQGLLFPPSPLEGITREENFSIGTAELTAQPGPDVSRLTAFRYIYTGLLNLSNELKTETGTFFGFLNPDEIIAFAYAIGRKAARAAWPAQNTLSEQMNVCNRDVYRQGSVNGLLAALQQRAREEAGKNYPVEAGSLEARLWTLQRWNPALEERALAAYLTAKVGTDEFDPEIWEEAIFHSPPVSRMTEPQLRSGILRLIGAAYRQFETKRQAREYS